MRVNSWVSILVFLGGLALFWHQRKKPRSQNYQAEPTTEEPIQTTDEPVETASAGPRHVATDRPAEPQHLDSDHAVSSVEAAQRTDPAAAPPDR
jgi:hypothetical protein